MTEYIIQSGNGFVLDEKELLMVGYKGRRKLLQSDAAMRAKRFSLGEAEKIMNEMESKGLECFLVKIIYGNRP